MKIINYLEDRDTLIEIAKKYPYMQSITIHEAPEEKTGYYFYTKEKWDETPEGMIGQPSVWIKKIDVNIEDAMFPFFKQWIY